MAHHKAAEKHLRASEKRKVHRKSQKSSVRTAVKRVQTLETKETAQAELRSATSMLDGMARKGIIHRNTAARQKSRLSKRIKALEKA